MCPAPEAALVRPCIAHAEPSFAEENAIFRAQFRLAEEARKVHVSSRLPASLVLLSRLKRPGSISTLMFPLGSMATKRRKSITGEWLISATDTDDKILTAVWIVRTLSEGRDGPSGWTANLLTGRSVVRTRPLPLDFPRLGFGNLAVSQPSCFLRVAWQLGTERVPQLNDFFSHIAASRHHHIRLHPTPETLLRHQRSKAWRCLSARAVSQLCNNTNK
ncbi:hypothetical protein CSKR_111091 [Clonorchis sinensis]|uniref:Uncharacterized protein n=1 Tax=Clonorchis sinensis TaxID=79923 RepID=A0A419QC06_CLOSI|nr:hypothetical protein CSKR_111091 [Clonorchis sinensis]